MEKVMFDAPGNSVGIDKRSNGWVVVVHENGKASEFGPYTEDVAKKKASQEDQRLSRQR